MTAVRYIRRPHRVRQQTYEYTRASRGDFVTWLHVAYCLLVILAVLLVTAVLGYWSPTS